MYAHGGLFPAQVNVFQRWVSLVKPRALCSRIAGWIRSLCEKLTTERADLDALAAVLVILTVTTSSAPGQGGIGSCATLRQSGARLCLAVEGTMCCLPEALVGCPRGD